MVLVLPLLPFALTASPTGGEEIEIGDDLLRNREAEDRIFQAIKGGNPLKAFGDLESLQWKEGPSLKYLEEQAKLIDRVEKPLLEKIRTSPPHPFTLFLQGKIQFLKGDYRGALVSVEKALEEKPNEINGLFLKGWVQFRLGLYRQSAKTLEKGLILFPTSERFFKNFQLAYSLGRNPNREAGKGMECEFLWELPRYSPNKKLLYLYQEKAELPFRDYHGEEDLEKNLEVADIKGFEKKLELERLQHKKAKDPKPPLPEENENDPELLPDQGENLTFPDEKITRPVSTTIASNGGGGDSSSSAGTGTPAGNADQLKSAVSQFKIACDMLEEDYHKFEELDANFSKIKELIKSLGGSEQDLLDLENNYQNAKSVYDHGLRLESAIRVYYSADEDRHKKVLELIKPVQTFSKAQFWYGYFYSGMSYLSLENFDGAIADLEKLRSLPGFKGAEGEKHITPENRWDLYMGLMRAYRLTGKYEAALEIHDRAFADFPDKRESPSEYFKIYAQAMAERHFYYLAGFVGLLALAFSYLFLFPLIAMFVRRIFTNPVERARELMRNQDIGGAVLYLEQLLGAKRLGKNEKVKYSELLIEAYFRAGHYEKCSALARGHLAECSECAEGIKYLARCYHREKATHSEAVELYKKYLAVDHRDSEVLLFAVPLFMGSDRSDVAFLIYEKFYRLEKGVPELNRILADQYLAMEAFNKETLKVFQTVLENEGDNFRYRMGLFKCFAKQGMNAEIINGGKPLLREHPDNIELHSLMVVAYKAVNMLEEAVLEYRQLTAEIPGNDFLSGILANLETELDTHKTSYLEEVSTEKPGVKKESGGILLEENFTLDVMDPFEWASRSEKGKGGSSPRAGLDSLIVDPFYDELLGTTLPYPAGKMDMTGFGGEEPEFLQKKSGPAPLEESLLLAEDPLDFDFGMESRPMVSPGREVRPSGKSKSHGIGEEFSPLKPEAAPTSTPFKENELLFDLPEPDELFDLLTPLSKKSGGRTEPSGHPLPGNSVAGNEIATVGIGEEVEKLITQNQLDKAVKKVREFQEKNGSNPFLDTLLLRCHILKRDKKAARDLFAQIKIDEEMLDPRSKAIFYDLGMFLETMGDFPGAIEVYNRILAVDIGFRDTFDRYEKLMEQVG